MTETRQFLIHHGAPILFVAVFLEQIGLPLPSLPWLLAAGALAATGQFKLWLGVVLAWLACMVADTIWFYLGRFRGHQVLNLLCRISLEPDSCVSRTQNMFTKYGWRAIVVAKFVPGLSTVAPPLAGMSSLSYHRFFWVDTAGSLLFGGCFLCLGFLFSSQIEQIGGAVASIGGSALCLVAGLFAAYIAFKFWQRKRLLGELRMARITVDDLRHKLTSGEKIVILDMRSSLEMARDPVFIEGAIPLTLDDVKLRRYQISPASEVVVYCSCPNEVTAARVALLLRHHGFPRVRPLLGGIDAWRDQNYPLSKRTPQAAGQKINSGVPQT